MSAHPVFSSSHLLQPHHSFTRAISASGKFLCRLVCLGLLSSIPALHAQTSPNLMDGPTGGSFSVVDERAPDEISEVSRLYLNGHLAATFRLTLNHEADETILPVPLGRTDIPYALCGEITVMRNGHQETHVVSSEGMLHHPDGQRYEAVSNAGFKDFFLVNYDDPTGADHRVGQSALCVSPNS